MWQSLWEWKCKMWQKYRLLFLLEKKKNHQPWNNLSISVPSVSLLVWGVMWISGAGALISAETSRKSLWRRRGREQCLAASAGCSDREKIEKNREQGREGGWFFLGLCKVVNRGQRGEQLSGETGRQVIILLYWHHDQAICPGPWHPLSLECPSLFSQFQEKGPAVQARSPPYSISLISLCTSFKINTVVRSLRILFTSCNTVQDLLKHEIIWKFHKRLSWSMEMSSQKAAVNPWSITLSQRSRIK